MFRPPVIIYGKGFNLRVLAIQSLCDVAGLKHETRNFATYDDMKKPEFLAVNPLGQIPAITVGNESVYQTTAILRHIARVGNYTLLGNNLYENAIVDQWCEFFNTEYNKYSVKLAYPIYGHQTFNSEEYQKTRTDFLRISRIIDNQLKG